MISPGRQMAFEILRRVQETGSYAADLLASRRLDKLSLEDRRFTYELVLGVLRWQGQLDYFIEKYAARPIEQFDLPVLIALRLALYQIRFLDRVPEHSAVDESVALVKARGAGHAAGFVNALLRRACRSKGDPPGEKSADELERLSIELSHPRWLVEKWIGDFGLEEAIALMRANNVPPPLVIRFNTLLGTEREITEALNREGVNVEPSRYVPGAYKVTSGTLSKDTPLLKQGWVYIQDEASQLVAHLVSPQPGMKVLDLCAAPGGKATHIAALMRNSGRIVAGDLHFHRVMTLRAVASRLGAKIIHPIVLDGRKELPFAPAGQLERVVVDAPCSGTGTLRRNPEIKWRFSKSDLRTVCQIQFALLSQAAMHVAMGGWLVYSTCALEPEENEEQVERFLAERREFGVLVPRLPDELLSGAGFVRTFPDEDGMDGFFVAVLERRGYSGGGKNFSGTA